MTKPNNFQRIRELNYLQQAVLAAAMIERMLPNYLLFSEALEFGNGTELRNVLNSIWEKLLLPKAKISLEKLNEKVELNTPDINDFDVFGVYPTIDVCTALITLINGLQQKEEANFVDVCKISQASVAKFIEYQLTLDGIIADNQAIREHDLMSYEMQTLSELIDKVATFQRIEKDAVKQLKQLATADGQTNIGIEY